jgi:hypothetical protein
MGDYFNSTEYIAECERAERYWAENEGRLEQIKAEIKEGPRD